MLGEGEKEVFNELKDHIGKNMERSQHTREGGFILCFGYRNKGHTGSVER